MPVQLTGALLAAAVCVLAAPAIPATTAATASCDRDAADQALKAAGFPQDENFYRPADVVCGAFVGPGSMGMAVVLSAPTCKTLGWVPFKLTDGEWKRVPGGDQLFGTIKLVPGGIRETVWVFRKSDPRCVPSGGTKARTWRWDGSGMKPGPWVRISRGEPRDRAFYSPTRHINCEMSDSTRGRTVFCEYTGPGPVYSATMGAEGRVKVCRNATGLGCIGNPGENTPVLHYGRHVDVGRFRCRSRENGMTCTVIKTGKGFRISRTGVVRVGG
jgi:hypothetical protein